MNISPEDHLRLKLSELKDIGLQWVDRAKKVGILLCMWMLLLNNLAMVLQLSYLFY